MLSAAFGQKVTCASIDIYVYKHSVANATKLAALAAIGGQVASHFRLTAAVCPAVKLNPPRLYSHSASQEVRWKQCESHKIVCVNVAGFVEKILI